MTATPRTKIIGAAVVTTAVAAAAAIALKIHASRSPSAHEAAAPSTGWCSPGESRVGALELDVDVTPPGAKAATRMTITGQWHATPSEARNDECDVVHELTGARASGAAGAPVSDADIAAWQERLQQRFWVTYRRDGAALRVHFPRSAAPSDENVLQMIVTALQVVQPSGDTEHWTALERDAAGMYMADYQRLAPGRFRKRKLTYTTVDAASGAKAPDGIAAKVMASEYTFSLAPARGVAAFEGDEQIRIGFSLGPNSWLDTRTRIRLQDVSVRPAPELIASLERARATVETSAVRTHMPDPEVTRAKEDAALLEGQSTEQLLAAARTPAAFGADRELAARLTALFRRRPEAVAPALAVARAHDDAHRITEAFAAAGTTASLAALGALASDTSVPEGSRVDALNALVLVDAPGVATTRIPVPLLDDRSALVRKGALLSGGALARAARRIHPEESERIDRALAARYAASRDDGDRIEVLSGIGNSAGPVLLPVIEAALRSEHPPLRAAAVTALRLADGPDVDTWIAQTLTHDDDARVRSAAVFASSFRTLGSLYDALEDAATHDKNEGVRRDAAALLRRAAEAGRVAAR